MQILYCGERALRRGRHARSQTMMVLISSLVSGGHINRTRRNTTISKQVSHRLQLPRQKVIFVLQMQKAVAVSNSPQADLMLDERRRWWSNNNPALNTSVLCVLGISFEISRQIYLTKRRPNFAFILCYQLRH